MYPNLEAEMARSEVSKRDLADYLSVRYATVIDKMKGRYDFTLTEAFKIQQKFFPHCSIEYLFARKDNYQNTA